MCRIQEEAGTSASEKHSLKTLKYGPEKSCLQPPFQTHPNAPCLVTWALPACQPFSQRDWQRAAPSTGCSFHLQSLSPPPRQSYPTPLPGLPALPITLSPCWTHSSTIGDLSLSPDSGTKWSLAQGAGRKVFGAGFSTPDQPPATPSRAESFHQAPSLLPPVLCWSLLPSGVLSEADHTDLSDGAVDLISQWP